MEKENLPVVVFDVLGPICGYLDDRKIIPVDEVADWIPAKVAELKGRQPKDLEEEVAWEEEFEREGVIRVVENPYAIQTIMYLHGKGVKPVIASSYTKKCSEFIIEQIVKDYNDTERGKMNPMDPEELFDSADIFSFTDSKLSKGNPEHWKQIIKPYKNVIFVFEDSFKRLKAAMEAYKCTGLHVTERETGLVYIGDGLRRKENIVYRNRMREHLFHFRLGMLYQRLHAGK